MKTQDYKSQFSRYVLTFVLAAYSLIIAFTQNYERLSADATIYLDLAKKYLNGDLTNAINGYWGPMLAWLFIPFMFFKIRPEFAINALNLIVGVVTIYGVWVLSYRFEITEKIRVAVVISLLPIMLFYSLVELIDFLLVCFIVYYLSIIFDNQYSKKVSKGILCGITGSLAYFSKYYAFPFFIVHFFIMNAMHYINSPAGQQRRMVLRNALAGFITFALISGLWVTAISLKYGHFTFSNTGKGNFAPIGPDAPQEGLERGVVIFHKGLFPPTNETATSAWEDPSYLWKDVKSWSPLDSPAHFIYFVKNIIRNIIDTLGIFESYSRLSIALLIAHILLILAGPINKKLLRGDRFYSLITILIYAGGYMPFHVENRYLWIINILLLLIGGHILTVMFKHDFFNKNIVQNFLIIIFVLSFIITPLKSYAQAGKNNINKDMYLLSRILKDKYHIKGNIASNREWKHIPVHDSWHKTFRLSFWLNSKYYGQTEAVISDEDLKNELERYNIDYYFFWGDPGDIPDFLLEYKEITNGEFPDLRIFHLKSKNDKQ